MDNILPNLIITRVTYPDGRFKYYVVEVASSDYVIHERSGDFEDIDPETGETIVIPYYTYGPQFIMTENYDWEVNPRGIEAVLISSLPPDADILRQPNPNPPHETV